MGQVMNSDNNKHDFDKLKRWHESLLDVGHIKFNYCAVFIVREFDKVAQDIFRGYRESFESNGATFANLVIFGQHGFSETAGAILRTFDLESVSLPSYVVIDISNPAEVYQVALPSGDNEQSELVCLADQVLSVIEGSVNSGRSFDGLSDISEVRRLEIGVTSFPRAIWDIIASLSI